MALHFFFQEVATVHESVRYNHVFRKFVDTILTKVTTTRDLLFSVLIYKPDIYCSIPCSLHVSLISFQCPTVYQEEMGRNVQSSRAEHNTLLAKRSLINLHKKVTLFFIILWIYMMQKYE